MIAGSYDDMQAGICYGPLAHAGPPRFKQAMWFDGVDDYIAISPNTGGVCESQNFLISTTVYDHISVHDAYPYIIISHARPSYLYGFALNNFSELSRFRWLQINPTISAQNRQVTQLSCYKSLSIGKAKIFNTAGSNEIATTTIIEWSFVSTRVGGPTAPITGFFTGVICDIRWYDITGYTESQADALALDPSLATPAIYWAGHGISNADWIDQGSEGVHHGTVIGSPEVCYIRGDGKIIKGGVIINP